MTRDAILSGTYPHLLRSAYFWYPCLLPFPGLRLSGPFIMDQMQWQRLHLLGLFFLEIQHFFLEQPG
jgi:hypothetical protein